MRKKLERRMRRVRKTRAPAPLRTPAEIAARREMRNSTRRAFLVGGAATVAGIAGWRWLLTRPDEDGIPWTFRRFLETNEHISRDLFSRHRLARQYDAPLAEMPRVNGDIG